MRLGPEAVPEFAATDVQGTQCSYRDRAIFDPAHARPFQAFADDLATCLGGTAADVPALVPVRGVVGAMTVVLEVANQLAQRLPHFGRRAWWQLQGTQEEEQRFASLLIEEALGLLQPLRAGLFVTGLPYLRKITKVFGSMIPIQNGGEILGQMAL